MTDDFEIAKPGSIYDTSIGMGYMQGELDPTSPRSSVYENPNILGITPLNQGENEFARQEKYGQTPSNDEAVGAGILHIDPNGYGLFVKRSTGGDYSGHWALPGGKIEKGETPFEAAERETIEEVGYIDNTEAHGEYNTFSPVHFKTFLKPVESQFEPNWMNECDDYKWAKLNNPPQPLHPGVEELLGQIYSSANDAEKWITIGKNNEGGGKGVHVKIETGSGKIVSGPAGMKGKTLEEASKHLSKENNNAKKEPRTNEASKEPVSLKKWIGANPDYKGIKRLGGISGLSINEANEMKSKLEKAGRLNKDGTISLFHVTYADNVDSINEHGLIPAKNKPAGQSFEAEHSKYAVYFHTSKDPAERDYKDANESAGENIFSLIEARIPINDNTLNRFVPDEDASQNPEDAFKILMEGGPVAFIGGVPKEAINSGKKSEDGYNPNEPRDPNGKWVEEQHVEAAKKHWDEWFEKQNYHEPSYWDMAHTAASMLFKGSRPNKITGLET